MERPPDLGRRLRAAREYAGLSQTALAEQIGIGQSSVNRYEDGQLPADPRLRHLLADWSKATGVPPDWFTAPWNQVGTAPVDDLAPEWVGELNDKLDLILAVVRRVYPDVASDVVTELLSGEPAPGPARRRRRG